MSSTALHKDLPTHQAYQTQQAPCSISEALINLRAGIQNADKDRNERCWLKTGLADFDEAFQGLRRGAVTVLASRPSMGRSALALNIATNVGIHQKIPTLYVSLDMPIWQLSMRIAALLGNIEVSALQEGKLTLEQDCQFSSAIDKVHDAPLHLMHHPYMDVDSLCKQVRKFAQSRQEGYDQNTLALIPPLSLLVIDDLGFADLQMKMGGGEFTAAYENAMYLLKDLAIELNIAILLLSTINPSAEERENKRSVFTDLPSIALARQSDALLFLYRDEVYSPEGEHRGQAELIMARNQHDLTGTVFLKTDLKYGRFGSSLP